MQEWYTSITKRDTRRTISTCECCGCEIKAENEEMHGDDYYLIDGDYIYEDCISDYVRDRFRVKG